VARAQPEQQVSFSSRIYFFFLLLREILDRNKIIKELIFGLPGSEKAL
jgi:hypothetical protein